MREEAERETGGPPLSRRCCSSPGRGCSLETGAAPPSSRKSPAPTRVPTPGLLSPTLPCSHPGRERLPDPQERGGVAPPAPQVTQVTQSYAFYYPGPRARGPGGAELSGASPALGTQFPLWRFPRRGASELAWVRRRSGPGREPRRPSKWLLCAPPSAQVPQCPGWRSSGRASPATLAFEDPRRPWARAAT